MARLRFFSRFALVGIFTTALSWLVFTVLYTLTKSPIAATVTRVCVTLPLLYLGYSRYLFAELLTRERAEVGPGISETLMIARIGAAIGASALSKIAIEPYLTRVLHLRFGASSVIAAPMIGDLIYGPLASYIVLWIGARFSVSAKKRSSTGNRG